MQVAMRIVVGGYACADDATRDGGWGWSSCQDKKCVVGGKEEERGPQNGGGG
jgi:hypothetical protein